MAEKKTIKITAGDVDTALKQGYPITCATCVHLYTACANGAPSCGKECGGPFVGKDFPEYKGQIPRDKFAAICLMCGDGAIRYRVVVSGKVTFALCETHKDALSGVVVTPDQPLNLATPLIIPIL